MLTFLDLQYHDAALHNGTRDFTEKWGLRVGSSFSVCTSTGFLEEDYKTLCSSAVTKSQAPLHSTVGADKQEKQWKSLNHQNLPAHVPSSQSTLGRVVCAHVWDVVSVGHQHLPPLWVVLKVLVYSQLRSGVSCTGVELAIGKVSWASRGWIGGVRVEGGRGRREREKRKERDMLLSFYM